MNGFYMTVCSFFIIHCNYFFELKFGDTFFVVEIYFFRFVNFVALVLAHTSVSEMVDQL